MSIETFSETQSTGGGEIIYDDPHHAELKVELTPIETTLGKAAMESLNKVVTEVNLPKVEALSQTRTAEQIIDILNNKNGDSHDIELNLEDAYSLIYTGQTRLFYRNIQKFQGLDSIIANELLQSGLSRYVVLDNLEKFQGLNHIEIANELIELGEDAIRDLLGHLEKFQGLNHIEIANKIIESVHGEVLVRSLEKLQGINHTEIANKLIESGREGIINLTGHLEKFQGLNHTEIANKLIESGRDGIIYFVDHLGEFQGLNHIEIANRLIELGEGIRVIWNLEKFQGINHTEIANKLIELDYAIAVADNLEKFQGLNHTEIANKLIELGYADGLAFRLANFKNLDYHISEILCDSFNVGQVLQNIGSFQSISGRILDSRGMSYKDSIKSNLFRFVNISENTLDGLRQEFDMPELTEMPKPRTDENGEVKQPSSKSIDRWYGDLSYTYMEGGFNKALIGHLIRMRIENGLSSDIHDASQWLSGFKIPESSYDIEAIKRNCEQPGFDPSLIDGFKVKLINTEAENVFFKKLLTADQALRDRLNYEGVQRELSVDEKLNGIFEVKAEVKADFNVRLGRESSQSADEFYNELLDNDPDLRAQYDTAMNNGGTRRKFFKELIKDNTFLTNKFSDRQQQLSDQIKNDVYGLTISINPELNDLINKDNQSVNNESWFFAPEKQLLFRAAMDRVDGLPLYKHADFSTDVLIDKAIQCVDNFYQTTTFGTDKEEYSHNLTKDELRLRLEKLRIELNEPNQESIKLGELAQELARARQARIGYITDTQNWLLKHSVSPQDRLTKIWGDRAMAIADGEMDNSTKIEQWQRTVGLKKVILNLEQTGELQSVYDLSYDEIMVKGKGDVDELLRRLSSINVLRAMAELKKMKKYRQENNIVSLLPSSVVDIKVDNDEKSKKYKFEILDKEDPRGFTIGEDTYCCMTIDGASSDCIRAGYVKGNCGFLTLHNEKETMVAQSFWFINPDHPDTLVLDNIEANKGQDMSIIGKVYKDALIEYIKLHPEIGITKVHVGTGYTDINLSGLLPVEPVESLSDVKYTDALIQKLLFDLSVAA